MTKKPVFPLMLCLCLGALPVFPFSAPAGMDKKIQEETRRITPELISIRRDIHAHPELALREERTSAIVADYFRKLGLEVRTGIGGTGVVGTLRGSRPGPVVAMRGDMDGLAITEETGLPFASKEKAIVAGREVGLMHACGHDVHTTVLMGVANVLSRFRGQLRGTVLFIAQPAEEWGNGAKAMIDAGVFAGVMPRAFFAYHVDDTARAGFVRYTPGFSGANCDGFTLKIKSEGCHGAAPSLCVDPIVVGAQIVVALQVLVSRQIDVHNDTVITVGQFHGGAAANIIPREAELKATIRSYGEEQRQALKDKVTRLIAHICEAAGAEFELDYVFGTPALYNDPELLREVLPTMERVLGGKSFLLEGKPEMGGEDFSEFARLAPAVMLDLGVVPKDIARTSVHSPTFIMDEDSIPVGVGLMSAVIWDYLARHAN
ncbi:MAG: M20 family metallopeptidase [Acidobacteriota bacterium]|nr:M20 family metallopeptidase [Acidobacteriota bacterium]